MYAKYHAISPWRAIGGGEGASCKSDRGYYGKTNRTTGHVSPYDSNGPSISSPGLFACVKGSWSAAATLDYVYGNFGLWTGFDYRGETALGWPDVSSAFGLHDLAGFPKDGTGYYKAWWHDGPNCSAVQKSGGGGAISLSISPGDWTAPVPIGTPIDVVATTCATAVQLFVNGVPQGRQPVPLFGYAKWPGVVFNPGNLTAVAYDDEGHVVTTETILSAGAASRLEMWVEAPYTPGGRNASVIAADGQDVALIGVRLIDAHAVVVPNADVNVTFTVDGPVRIIGVANGDPADHSPDKASWRNTFHGLARVIVASSRAGSTGEFTVTASATGLHSDKVMLEAK